MTPDPSVYKRIYENLGDDFLIHLKAGDLNLYQTDNKGELVKKGYAGRVFIHLPGSANSIETAKNILAGKFLEQTKNEGLQERFQVTSSDFSDFFKTTILFEILKIAASQDVFSGDKSLVNSGINEMDQDMRFEIAQIACKTNPNVFFKQIQDYNLSENQQFEIAKIKALDMNCQLKNIINNLVLTREHRFEVIKIAAMNVTTNISKDITSFGFNQEQRHEIAKIILDHLESNFNKDFISSFYNFNLNEVQTAEIAKILSQKEWYLVDHHFQNPDNRNLSLLYELTKIKADQGENMWISKHINKFEPNRRYEIALIGAKSRFFSRIVRECNLNEEERYRVALVNAAHNGGEILKVFFDKYEITDQSKLFEIAKIAAAKNGDNINENIHELNLTSDQELQVLNIAKNERFQRCKQEISKTFFSDNIEQLKQTIFRFHDYEKSDIYFSAVKLMKYRDLTDEEIQEIAVKSPFYAEISHPLQNIYSQENQQVRKTLSDALGRFLIICEVQNISHDNLKLAKPLIQELFDFRDPNFRFQLIPILMKTLSSDEKTLSFNKLFKLTEKIPKLTETKSQTISESEITEIKERKPFTSLICMLLSPYLQDSDLVTLAEIIKIRTFQNSNIRNPFIKNLEKIVSEPSYSFADKQKIISALISEDFITAQTLVKNVNQIACLLNFGKAEVIKNALSTEKINFVETFNALVDDLLNKELGLTSVENSSDKFLQTFGSFQEPEKLFQYAATLKTLPQSNFKEHMDCLREYVVSVLERDFPSMRYTTDNNIHLHTIFNTEKGEVLKEEWQKGAIYEDIFEPKNILEKREIKFDRQNYFKEKIIQKGFLKEEEFPDLFAVMKNPAMKDQIKEKLDTLLTSEKPNSPEEIHLKKVYSFQLQMINFMYPDQNSQIPPTALDFITKIENLLNSLKKIYKNQQNPLIDDLEEVIKTLKNPQVSRQPSRFEGFKIIDTDDPDRLLNLGSIAGSCLNVNRGAGYSKCLLSYLLDGKNRAMIITDNEGIMVARAVIRILWDPIQKVPVFMKECTYPRTGLDPLLEKALIDACKRRGLELNLPLISVEDSGFPYPNNVVSLDGRAPSEFVDANPFSSGNKWTIQNMFLVV